VNPEIGTLLALLQFMEKAAFAGPYTARLAGSVRRSTQDAFLSDRDRAGPPGEMDHKVDKKDPNGVQMLLGLAALLAGCLVYLMERPPENIGFLKYFGISRSFLRGFPSLLGSAGHVAPSFFHVWAFIFLTSGVVAAKRKAGLMICLCWFFTDTAFEVGQKFHGWCAKVTPECLRSVPFLENVRNYFVNGTFDVLDLVSIALGTVTAYAVLMVTMKT
jgi:hypothetical protein